MANSIAGIASVMISVHGREDVCRRTQEQVARRFGIYPTLFVNGEHPPGKANHLANVRAALEGALAQGAEHVLFLEDDLDFADSFPSAVQAACASAYAIVALYAPGLRYYPLAVQRQIARGRCVPGLYPVVNRREWFGSQALVLRRSAAQTCLTWYEWLFLDLRLQKLVEHPMAIYAPNPVQHYGARLKSTWGRGKPHTSASYIGDTPWTP